MTAQLGFADLLTEAATTNEQRQMDLPGTMEEALPFYRLMIETHHAAMQAADIDKAMSIREEAHLLAAKLRHRLPRKSLDHFTYQCRKTISPQCAAAQTAPDMVQEFQPRGFFRNAPPERRMAPIPPHASEGAYVAALLNQGLLPADAECSARSLLSGAGVVRRSGLFGHEGDPAGRVVCGVAVPT